MEKFLVLLFALCVVLVPSIVSGIIVSEPLSLTVSAYCDQCNFGFESVASKPLAGAKGKLVCTKRSNTKHVTHSQDFLTGADGKCILSVDGDFGDDICHVIAVSSSDSECSKPTLGRDKASVVLTRHNGISTNARFANALGFDTASPLADCANIRKQYEEEESED